MSFRVPLLDFLSSGVWGDPGRRRAPTSSRPRGGDAPGGIAAVLRDLVADDARTGRSPAMSSTLLREAGTASFSCSGPSTWTDWLPHQPARIALTVSRRYSGGQQPGERNADVEREP